MHARGNQASWSRLCSFRGLAPFLIPLCARRSEQDVRQRSSNRVGDDGRARVRLHLRRTALLAPESRDEEARDTRVEFRSFLVNPRDQLTVLAQTGTALSVLGVLAALMGWIWRSSA